MQVFDLDFFFSVEGSFLFPWISYRPQPTSDDSKRPEGKRVHRRDEERRTLLEGEEFYQGEEIFQAEGMASILISISRGNQWERLTTWGPEAKNEAEWMTAVCFPRSTYFHLS